MARTLYRLTDKIARNIAAPGYHADGGGLYLQISKSGSKSWVFRFTLRRRTRDMGLGSAQAISITEARAKTSECRAHIAKGIDPIEHAKSEREASTSDADEPTEPAGPTFREFAAKYIDDHTDDWRNAKHAAQWLATLNLHVFPIIGNLQLDAIGTPEVLAVLEPIWRGKSETASRIRGRIDRILAAASVRGLGSFSGECGCAAICARSGDGWKTLGNRRKMQSVIPRAVDLVEYGLEAPASPPGLFFDG